MSSLEKKTDGSSAWEGSGGRLGKKAMEAREQEEAGRWAGDGRTRPLPDPGVLS